ncbi:hypothetical protein ACFFSW_22765 [Saccharothrix longispora]|uniref:Uncharacterized protein n=1 Tax=Saccharothrix longispora TaxID=33920 RepID=A0ABU1PRV8_9PSEU|nr:hypothetical protein [Saccharothrix longispora]MDR6593008.1 hypothetical protein [Saccharothrix longispora]
MDAKRKNPRTTRTAGWTGLVVAGLGAPAYALCTALIDDGTGPLGFVGDVATLWGRGTQAALVLLGLAVLLALEAALTRGFTSAGTKTWAVVPPGAAAGLVAAPLLVLVAVPCLLLLTVLAAISGDDSPRDDWIGGL